MNTLSTTIAATPMPNATGTETQPASMVEVKALEWEQTTFSGQYCLKASSAVGDYWLISEKGRFSLVGPDGAIGHSREFARPGDGYPAAQADFERRVLACLHPAPATLADETLRAENERLTRERDAQYDENVNRIAAEGAAILRAEAAEAKLAALSQPAPVVEDGTAREENSGCHPSHVTRSGDASTFDEICTLCGAKDISGGGWGKLSEPCPAAPAVPDGRTEEAIRQDERDRLYRKANADYLAAEEREDAIAEELHSTAAFWLGQNDGKSEADRAAVSERRT